MPSKPGCCTVVFVIIREWYSASIMWNMVNVIERWKASVEKTMKRCDGQWLWANRNITDILDILEETKVEAIVIGTCLVMKRKHQCICRNQDGGEGPLRKTHDEMERHGKKRPGKLDNESGMSHWQFEMKTCLQDVLVGSGKCRRNVTKCVLSTASEWLKFTIVLEFLKCWSFPWQTLISVRPGRPLTLIRTTMCP